MLADPDPDDYIAEPDDFTIKLDKFAHQPDRFEGEETTEGVEEALAQLD